MLHKEVGQRGVGVLHEDRLVGGLEVVDPDVRFPHGVVLFHPLARRLHVGELVVG